jgi:hypothetical protein
MTAYSTVTTSLTDTAIRNTKPGTKPTKLSDGGGLYLLLNPNGSRWWRLDYRFTGKRKTLSMGVYPDVSLKDARSRQDEARKLLAADVDPGENRKAVKASKIAETANSVEIVTREWFAKYSTIWNDSHGDRILTNLSFASSRQDHRFLLIHFISPLTTATFGTHGTDAISGQPSPLLPPLYLSMTLSAQNWSIFLRCYEEVCYFSPYLIALDRKYFAAAPPLGAQQ